MVHQEISTVVDGVVQGPAHTSGAAALVRKFIARGSGLVLVIGLMQFLDYTTDVYVVGVWAAKGYGLFGYDQIIEGPMRADYCE